MRGWMQGEEAASQPPPPPPPPQAPKPPERDLNDYADAFGSVRRIDAHQTSSTVANGCALFSLNAAPSCGANESLTSEATTSYVLGSEGGRWLFNAPEVFPSSLQAVSFRHVAVTACITLPERGSRRMVFDAKTQDAASRQG